MDSRNKQNSIMRLHNLLLLLLIGLTAVAKVTADFDDDDDDEGAVEVEPDETEPIVTEKPVYETPKLKMKPFFAEPFDNVQEFKKRWTQSQAKKDGAEEEISKYDGKWAVEEPKESSLLGDLGLILKSKAKHHAVASKLDRPFDFSGKPFIVSYEVKFQNGLDCGGAYIKLLSGSDKIDLKSFHDKTPYTVMFGPDKCGLDHKLHFIFRHKNPLTGEIEEKHANKPSGKLDKYFTDKKTHLYTLVVNPDNTFEVSVDNNVVNSGSLLEDVNPPVNPPKEIEDPKDKKPEDWDENEKIPDPDASKPEDWDEDQPIEIPDESAVKPDGWLDDEQPLIPDPDAAKPDDWDEEMDGEWEAPLIENPECQNAPGCGEWNRPNIPNPLYKGKWRPPMIDNPNYQGEWKPRRISNPHWFEDNEPYKMTPINALGLELWSMTDEIVFDNFIITDDREEHTTWLQQTWEKKNNAELYSSGGTSALVQGILDVTQDRPWLWAVFLVVVVLPVVLLVAYCCISKDKSEDIDAARKKTDEPSPDDESEVKGDNPDETGDSKKTAKKSKAALEPQEEPEVEEDEEISQEESQEEADEKSGSPRRSPRKRKSRKD
ncbi:calnexin-like isoform X2 [Mya arenaria]|uniref:calnexin-like isoform X2 n=1 Tax=Mya arenaria TaxID=6604 RepID=UPI0022E7CF64|nr:calnexin-like isoform X2 [Mya arenaria]